MTTLSPVPTGSSPVTGAMRALRSTGRSASRGHRRHHLELVPHLTRDPPAGVKASLREVDGAGRRDPEHGGATRAVVGIENAHGGAEGFPLEIEAAFLLTRLTCRA